MEAADQSEALITALSTDPKQLGLTMLLPTNSAVQSFLHDMGDSNSTFKEALPVLMYHLHTGMLFKNDITADMELTMQMGGTVAVETPWDDSLQPVVFRDNAGRTAHVVSEGWNIAAGPDAVAHIIDRVLVPIRPSNIGEALAWSSDFSIFRLAALAAGYEPLLNSSNANVTIFVPTDAAFVTALDTLEQAWNITLNVTSFLANKTLVQSIVSAHIITSVFTWSRLQVEQLTYLPTCSTCSTVYVEVLDYGSSPLDIYGEGNIRGEWANIPEVDLVAGQFAFIQVLNAVLLPLEDWGKCYYPCLVNESPVITGGPKGL